MDELNHFDVLGLGSVAVDFVAATTGWPEEGAKQALADLSIHDGGLVGTGLVAVSRLGGRACFAGKLGYSEMARRAIAGLRNEGVDTSFVLRTKDAEPIVAFVITNTMNGERTIFFTRRKVTYPFPSEFADQRWYEKIKVLLIDSESGRAGVEAARIARKQVVPESFAADYTTQRSVGDMLRALRMSPDQTVIITRGEQGCVGLSEGRVFELPAFDVDVVDTTGCGDVFHGAYALAIARKQTVYDSARFASAAAALCATRPGGRDGIPTQKELRRFMGDPGWF